jgi:nucleotide-binding universal stress UspA family protein
MYRNVIVGVDGREGGRDAAVLAAQLASPGASLMLTWVNLSATAGHESNLDLERASDSSLPAMLELELNLCRQPANLRRVTANSVGAGLEKTAERLGADLIVVGSSRRHGVTRLLFGDDVKSVIHRSALTVAVAPPSYVQKEVDLRRIGVGWDGSPESEVALAHAGLLAREQSAELTVRHVVAPPYYPVGWGMVAAPIDDPGVELAAAQERFTHVDGVEVEHVHGAVGQELVALSQTVDLLVCGSRRNGAMRQIAVGSTSEFLTRRVEVPLLIAPSTDAASVGRWQTRQKVAVA